jgi:uncharacterized protein YceK
MPTKDLEDLLMRKRWGIIFLSLVSMVLSGCGALFMSSTDRAVMSGRYAEVEADKADVEKKISNARSEEIIDLCYAYWKQKKYHPLFSCLDRLEANIAAGDDNVFPKKGETPATCAVSILPQCSFVEAPDLSGDCSFDCIAVPFDLG